MKSYKNILAALGVMACMAGFTSCDDDFDRPPVIVPEATYVPNTTVEEFKTEFAEYGNSGFGTIPVNLKGDSIIIKGIITSSDSCGNVYKYVNLQDETGAIQVKLNMNDIYESYHPGQEVYINVTGLLVGNYGKLMQIGGLYNNNLGNMEEDEFLKRAQRNRLPSKSTVTEMITDMTIADLAAHKTDAAWLKEYGSRIIRLSDVHFNGGGSLRFSDNPGNTSSTNRTLLDEAGNAITVRTSDRCKFAADLLPAGKGTVIAFLSYFNTDWQLTIENPETGCIGFDGVPEEPVGPSGDDLFAETFADNLGKFTIVNVNAPSEVPEVWKHDSHKYAIATGYANQTNYACDSWLISPVIDLSKQTKAYLSFEQVVRYFSSDAAMKSEAAIALRQAGTTEWTVYANPASAQGSDWTFVKTGDLDISAFAGKQIEIGFHYTSTASKAGTWQIKNIAIRPTGTPVQLQPVTPDTPAEPTGDTLFSETFADGQGAFTVENVKMDASMSYIWSAYAGASCMKASAYVSGNNYESDSYLISPVIDLAGATAPSLSFEQAINFFADPATAAAEVSINIREQGASSWTKLTIPTFPSSMSWSFVPTGDISLSAYAGKKVQVAFRYTSTASKAGTWEIKNLTVKK